MEKKLPNIINSKENVEATPKVEHLIFGGNNNILIRTVFPRENDWAVCYILVHSPTSEGGMENLNEAIASADESSGRIMRETSELLNKPFIFKGLDEAQEWFNQSKHVYSRSEREKIAAFLGVVDVGD